MNHTSALWGLVFVFWKIDKINEMYVKRNISRCEHFISYMIFHGEIISRILCTSHGLAKRDRVEESSSD